MSTKRFDLIALLVMSLFLVSLQTALAHGDSVIPQVPDGPSFRTKFDFTNLGPDPATAISNVTVLFFHQNGTPWTIATNQGTSSQFPLRLGARQTLRLETLGQTLSDTSGYVIVRNLEVTDQYPDDYEVAITAYYEVRNGGKVVDTVSVAVAQPTVWFAFPVQTENSQNLYTGFAAVNLSGSTNKITMDLYQAGTPSTAAAVKLGSGNVSLAAGEQKAIFLYPSIFPNQPSVKGMIEAVSDGPVAILALLQSPTSAGVQYATMAPTYKDALRHNTQMYLQEGLPLDADIPVSDYFGNANDPTPWDVLYQTDTPGSQRHLQAENGAGFAILGSMPCTNQSCPFDDVSLADLRNLDYSATSINLDNDSANLSADMAFAIRTGLGQYVKVRILYVINAGTNQSNRDLVLEIFVYR